MIWPTSLLWKWTRGSRSLGARLGGAAYLQNLHVSICKIGPVVDEPACVAGDFDSSAKAVSFFGFGEMIGKGAEPIKKYEEAFALALGRSVQRKNCLKIDQQPVFHGHLVLPTFLEVLEIDPMIRILIIDLAGQFLAKVFVTGQLHSGEKGEEFTLLGGREFCGLLFELRERHGCWENNTREARRQWEGGRPSPRSASLRER